MDKSSSNNQQNIANKTPGKPMNQPPKLDLDINDFLGEDSKKIAERVGKQIRHK
jgi:hypothetical protein